MEPPMSSLTLHYRPWASNYPHSLWATTLPRVWWISRPAPFHYTPSINRDDNILSRNENQRANIIRGTLPTEFVTLHDGNESLRHALDTVHRDSARMCGELDNVRRGTDLALRLADDATLAPAVSASSLIDRTPMSLPAVRPSLAGGNPVLRLADAASLAVFRVRLLSYRADVCSCSIYRVHRHLPKVMPVSSQHLHLGAGLLLHMRFAFARPSHVSCLA